MRKSILFGLALLSLGALSCTREAEAPVAAPQGGRTVTLGVSVADSKAAIDGEGKFTWQAGDKIAVETSDGFATFNLTSGAGSDAAEFSATIPDGVELGASAIYPAALVSAEGFAFPESYCYEADNTNVPLLGDVADGKIAMQYAGGVVRIPVKDIPEGAAAVSLTADKMIWGALERGETGFVAGEGASAVSIAFSAAEPAMTFNFPVPVGEFVLGIKALAADGTVLFEKQRETATAVAAGSVIAFNELSLKQEVPALELTPVSLWQKTVAELGIPASTNHQSLQVAYNGSKIWLNNEDKVYGYDLLTGATYKDVTFPTLVRSLDSDDTHNNVIWSYDRRFQEGDPAWSAPEPVYITKSVEGVSGTLEAPVGFREFGVASNAWADKPNAEGPLLSNFKISGDADGEAVLTYAVSSWGAGYGVPMQVTDGALTGDYIWISPLGDIALWNPFNTQVQPYGTKLTDGILYTCYSGNSFPIKFSNKLTIRWANNVAKNNFDLLETLIENPYAWRIYRTDIITYKGHRLYALFTHCVDDAIANDSNYLSLYDITDLSNPVRMFELTPADFLARPDGYSLGDSIYPGDVKLINVDDVLYAICTDGRNGTVNAFKFALEEAPVDQPVEGNAEGPDVTTTPGGKF